MKDIRKEHGTVDKLSLEQQLHKIDSYYLCCEENWSCSPSATECCGRLADEIVLNLKIMC